MIPCDGPKTSTQANHQHLSARRGGDARDALLDGARGRPTADVATPEALLVRISDFVVRRAERIEEMDLNPVWVGAKGEGAMPFDAVIIERVEQGA